MTSSAVDVAIIGAGIVGAALARALSQQGCSVTVVEAATPGGGATAQGMGHLVVLDDNGYNAFAAPGGYVAGPH